MPVKKYTRSHLHYFSDNPRSTNMVFTLLYGIFGAALALVFARDISSSSPSSKSSRNSFTDNTSFQTQTLNYHNYFRTQHNATPLTWNTTLASSAESWAQKCEFKHSQAGQNLVAGFPDIAHSIDAWGLERTDYNWEKPGFGENTGHFTQLVWKGTGEVGCGRWLCPAGTIFSNFEVWYLVCNYADAGNVVGGDGDNEFFRENVGIQVDGEADMGIVSLLESERAGISRGKGEVGEALLSVGELRTRAVEVVERVREDASGLLAALAAKVF